MKIVLFNKQEKAGGGVGVFNARFKEYLQKRGHRVFEMRYSREKENRGFIRLPYLFADRNTVVLLPSIGTKKIIEDHLKRIQPDIVYMPLGLSTFDFYVPRICHKLEISLMGVLHVDISRSNRLTKSVSSLPFRFGIPICKKLDLLQVFSKELKRFYVSHGVPANKIVVIPNGVDLEKYSPGKSKFKGKNRFKKGVLFLGRLTWLKNPELLIQSFVKIADGESKLFIAGTGDLEEELKEKYESDRVVFLGLIKDEKVKIDLIRGCDVFVLPSRYEGMSLSLLECMSTGLACIASDVASQREMLRKVGIVIPYGKLKEKLPGELNRLLNNDERRTKLGRLAREKVILKYSQKKVFEEIEGNFIRLISRK